MRSKQLLSIMGCGLAALSSCAAGKKQVAEKPNILLYWQTIMRALP